MHFPRPLIRSAKRSGAGQRSGHARSASGRSSLPAFPRINLPCTGQREGEKKARGVSPRTDWPPMIRGTASHGRLPVPLVPPHHRRPPSTPLGGRTFVTDGWPVDRPRSFVPSPIIMTPSKNCQCCRVSASMHALARSSLSLSLRFFYVSFCCLFFSSFYFS